MIEIARISHHGINYILGDDSVKHNGKKLPYVYLSLTNKSSKKFRDKKTSNKNDSHFNLIKVKEPIKLYNKIFNILNEYLKEFDNVIFCVHHDDKDRRLELYIKMFEKMGFMYKFEYTNTEYNIFDTVMCRNRISRKEVNSISDSLTSIYFI